MAINYSLAAMANPQDNEEPKKWYSTAQSKGTLTLPELAQHMHEHNTPFTKGVIQGILTDAQTCLRELLLDGYRVELGALGTFYVTLSSEGTLEASDFTANNITKVKVRWQAGEDFGDLRQDATFTLVPLLKHQAAVLRAVKDGRGDDVDALDNVEAGSTE